MKAIFFEKHGGVEVLKYADLKDPEPKHGEALIKVKAVALNHLDIWVRRGWEGLTLPFPHISGSDIVGEIVSVNADSVWKKGTKVFINPGFYTQEDEWTRNGQDSLSPHYKIVGEHIHGGMAEYVSVPINSVFTAPSDLKDEEIAAPILVGTTCWRMLTKRAKVIPGETLLVVGTGGGVNSLCIQMANAMGLNVFALAGSAQKAKIAEKLGASYVINYKDQRNWHIEILKYTKGRGVDIVIDNVGAETFSKSLRAATRGGRIVTVGNTKGYELNLDNRLIFTKQLSILGSTMGSRQDLIDAMQFIHRTKIRIPIDKIEPLKNGLSMLKRLEDGEQTGKIVLKP